MGRDGPAQLVVVQGEVLQVGQATQLRWDGPAQLVAVQGEVLQIGQAPQLGRDGPGQLVVIQEEDLQIGQAAQLGRDGPAQLVDAQAEPLQIGQAAQLGRDASAQLVVVQVEVRQIGQAAQLGRDGPAQLVAVQFEHLQVGQAAQLGRDAADQVVDPQVKPGDVTPAARHAVPGAGLVVLLPVGFVVPVVAVGAVVQRDQRLALRLRDLRHIGAACPGIGAHRRIGGCGSRPVFAIIAGRALLVRVGQQDLTGGQGIGWELDTLSRRRRGRRVKALRRLRLYRRGKWHLLVGRRDRHRPLPDGRRAPRFGWGQVAGWGCFRLLIIGF